MRSRTKKNSHQNISKDNQDDFFKVKTERVEQRVEIVGNQSLQCSQQAEESKCGASSAFFLSPNHHSTHNRFLANFDGANRSNCIKIKIKQRIYLYFHTYTQKNLTNKERSNGKRRSCVKQRRFGHGRSVGYASTSEQKTTKQNQKTKSKQNKNIIKKT